MSELVALLSRLVAKLIGRAPAEAVAQPAATGESVVQPVLPDPEPSPGPTTTKPSPADGLTARAAIELIGHEAIVREAYKDSRGIWTWGIGVTDASGHMVERYIDQPQALEQCLTIFIWLLRTKYLPAVVQAFEDHVLTEAQLAAALSFHYNTGAILHASWVTLWRSGDVAGAEDAIMQWHSPASIIPRREKERDLFFDGTWSNDGKATVFPVLKPSYQPDFHHPTRVDVAGALNAIIGDPA